MVHNIILANQQCTLFVSKSVFKLVQERVLLTRESDKHQKMSEKWDYISNSITILVKTSRFPYIGSWCVLSTVVTQYVMAAVCFQSMFIHFLGFQPFMFSKLGRLPFPICVASPSGSQCVSQSVSQCVSQCVSFCSNMLVNFVHF